MRNLTPGDMVNDIQHDHGVMLSYPQAWRGTEVAQEINEGSHVKAYKDFTNFMYGCKTLMGLDETFLKGRYKRILLAAVGVDANENIFPITYEVESWTWFIELFNEQFDERSDLPALTIILDFQKGLQATIEKVFSSREQGYCMNHLVDNLKNAYRNLVLTKLYWKATHALFISDFDKYMTKIKSRNDEAYVWIMLSIQSIEQTHIFGGIDTIILHRTSLNHITGGY
ncbi:uncharacterized protein LOC105420604 [Amborella trichopoda]|uniref:uncharacterized protein LOC105420604 n=1 Tax=Amborella trichopoda TaxID=13333 RepID=UPI0005D39CC0|nr:uncharacterized protein LOC105420604 [Amborella trichopoda]|eukprot:XP_011623171.1 uncharacterized protein LOC105420604 [Amborella trichopoda]